MCIMHLVDNCKNYEKNLALAAGVYPEIWKNSAGYLALSIYQKSYEFMIFDSPMFITETNENYTNIVNLEKGFQSTILSQHLQKAIQLKIIEIKF